MEALKRIYFSKDFTLNKMKSHWRIWSHLISELEKQDHLVYKLKIGSRLVH